MRYVAHTYQQRASQFIVNNDKCGLFLDMGLGKTVSTLTAIRELIHFREEVKRVLIIAPKSVALNTWTAEVEKWNHTKPLRLSLLMGTVAQREKALTATADIYVINRENLSWLVSKVKTKWQWDMVVVDESSSFKNPQSQRFKALKKVVPFISRLVLLTGTPSPNGLMDLWSQVYLLDRGERLGRTLTMYRANYFTPGKRNGAVIYEWKPQEGADEKITDKISDICMSMRVEDYLSLPDKIESNSAVYLSDKEMRAYKAFEREQVLSLETEEEVTALTAATLMNKLCQFTGGAIYKSELKDYAEVSTAKLEALEDIIDSTEEPILVYYQYQSERERLMLFLSRFKPVCFSGDSKILQEWNKGKIRVLLSQPQSIAYGLNMQHGGRAIVWYSLTWNLEIYQQANARLHRQGQTKPVLLYHLVAKNTIDEKILKALQGKEQVQDKLIEMLKNLK